MDPVALDRFGFFDGVPKERLAPIESVTIAQNYEQGEVVFQSGEPAKNLYVLASGEVELSLLFKEEKVTREIKYEDYINTRVERFEKPIVFEQVKPGQIFGWSALVVPQRMTATARCATASQILLIPASELKKVFGRDPELGFLLSTRISNTIAQRLKSRTEKLVAAWGSTFGADSIETV